MSGHRRPSQKQRVLQLLRDAGTRGVRTNEFLSERLPRFGARIYELRNQGCVIDQRADPQSESGALYVLVAEGQGEPIARPRAKRQPSIETRIDALAQKWGLVVVSTRREPAHPITRWTISGGPETEVFAGESLTEALHWAEGRLGSPR